MGAAMPLGMTRWPMWRRWFGNRSERSAARFLRKLGYRIVARNVELPGGELDIVALDRRVIVFVEVRSTAGNDIDRPTLSVDSEKQRRLTDLALSYLTKHKLLDHATRFDVVAVSWPADQRHPRIVHFPSAFEPVGRFQMYN